MYKNPVPDDRTIVPGSWSDNEDCLQASFETSSRGVTGLGVFVQDQTSDPVDVRISRTLNETTTAAESVINSSTITLSPGHGAVVGNNLGIVNLSNSEAFFLGDVLGVAGDIITVDSPVNQIYPAGSLVRVGTHNLNVLGTLADPVVFSVRPIPGLIGDITRVIMELQDNVAMDFSTFGSLAPLTNGCVLRVKHSDGSYTNLFNFKTNGDYIARGFDHSFQSKVGGGLHSLIARSTWGGQAKRGVVIRLDGSLGEEIQIVIQDDLTAISKFILVAQGHLTQNGD